MELEKIAQVLWQTHATEVTSFSISQCRTTIFLYYLKTFDFKKKLKHSRHTFNGINGEFCFHIAQLALIRLYMAVNENILKLSQGERAREGQKFKRKKDIFDKINYSEIIHMNIKGGIIMVTKKHKGKVEEERSNI